ncbi:MAG: DNA repair protein RecO [Anaerolineales bacterium]|nr:MAG: DNA repair protein RecO [Anaerolineales bacterium]
MDRERLYRTDGLILHRTDFGEADSLLTVFTPHLGRLRMLAKGARKPTSRKAGHVEPFTYVHLLVARGRNLDIVSQAEALESFRPLRESLERASQAYYLGELINSFIGEGDENPLLFDLALATLARLCEARDRMLVLRFFELHCLRLVGYQPQLHFCVECQTQLDPVTNYFHPPSGGMLCPRHGEAIRAAEPLAMPTFKVLRYVQTHPWDQVAILRVKPETHLDLEAVLQRYIVYLLERRLKSVEFIHRLRREVQISDGR